jgi:hypothetical protein
MSGIKLQKLTAKDIPQIVAIHDAITKNKDYRGWSQQMVKDHVRKREWFGFVAKNESRWPGSLS